MKDVREAAIVAMAEIGGDDAARAVAPALHDDDVAIREEAVEALGDIGGEVAIRFLQQALSDHHRPVREAAEDNLVKLWRRER